MDAKKKSMTVRLTEKEFKEIKIKLINDDKSFQKYVMELIKKDMKGGNVNGEINRF